MFKIEQFSFKEKYFEEMIVIDSNSEIISSLRNQLVLPLPDLM